MWSGRSTRPLKGASAALLLAQGGQVGRLQVAGGWVIGLLLSAGAVAAEETSVGSSEATQQEAGMALSVQDNMDVEMEYTLTSAGVVMDSTDGKEPFHYLHGSGQIIPGLEHQLAGLHVGDTKEVTVGPEEGYGQTDPAAVIEVPKAQLPADVTPTVGMVLRGVNPDGKSFRAKISEVKNETVVLDLNHPLAGKTLNFKVKILNIKPATTVN